MIYAHVKIVTVLSKPGYSDELIEHSSRVRFIWQGPQVQIIYACRVGRLGQPEIGRSLGRLGAKISGSLGSRWNSSRHRREPCDTAITLVVTEEEGFVLDDGSAYAGPELVQTEFRLRQSLAKVIIRGIKDVISKILKHRAMQIVRPRFCNYVDDATTCPAN